MEAVTSRGLWCGGRKCDPGEGRSEELMVHEHLLCAIHCWVLHLLSLVILIKSYEGDQGLPSQIGNQCPGRVSDLPKASNTNRGISALVCLNPKVLDFDDVRLIGDTGP